LFTEHQRFRTHAQARVANVASRAAQAVPGRSTWQKRLFLVGMSLFGLGITSFGIGSAREASTDAYALAHPTTSASSSPGAIADNSDPSSGRITLDPRSDANANANALPAATKVSARSSTSVKSLLGPAFDLDFRSLIKGNTAEPNLLYSHDWMRRGDTATSLLARMGVQDDELALWMRSDDVVRGVLANPNSKRVNAAYTLEGQVQQLVLRWVPDNNVDTFTRLTISRNDNGQFSSQTEQIELQRRQRLISGRIESSLFAATEAADIPDAMAMNVAEVFANDIDFNRDLRKGDTFSLVYEELEADGEPFKTGRLLAARFVNNGRELNGIWFANGTDKGEYFDLEGNSTRRFYLASPMEFSRVTSSFAMRFHPIQKRWKRHLGVDYGAPTGTPVRTVGDGRVIFAGVKRGFGNVIEIQHDSKNTTLYAHLSRFYVRKGQRVERGERIGAVGSTGWATGPHLHFEHRVAGVHQNPALLARNSRALTIAPERKSSFMAVANTMSSQLEAASWMTTASASN
jgi:murein DD-endopeptidase MepM/ murein hydrolase activator NlpD